jgi:hypothetical protein
MNGAEGTRQIGSVTSGKGVLLNISYACVY